MIHSLIHARSVFSVRSSTGTIKIFFDSRSYPPNIQLPFKRRPRLYLRWPIFASSISTVSPGPPSFSLHLLAQYAQTCKYKNINNNICRYIKLMHNIKIYYLAAKTEPVDNRGGRNAKFFLEVFLSRRA